MSFRMPNARQECSACIRLDFRAPSWRGRGQFRRGTMEEFMARANRIREIWAEGKAVINSWCGIPSSFSAEVMAHMGWDSLVVDMQHGMIEYQTMGTVA